MDDRSFTDTELDTAIAQIADPARLRAAQQMVARAAPALQRVLAAALADGGWFDAAHDQAVREAAGQADGGDRIRAVHTLIAEETRLSMLVGVAVGFELAQELSGGSPGEGAPAAADGSPGAGPDDPTPDKEH